MRKVTDNWLVIGRDIWYAIINLATYVHVDKDIPEFPTDYTESVSNLMVGRGTISLLLSTRQYF